MKTLPGALLIFVGVLGLGMLGAKVMNPHRSFGEIVGGDDRDYASDTMAVDFPPWDPAANCLAVPKHTLDYIEKALTGEGVSLRAVRAHRPGNFARPFIIAAELDGPEMEGEGEIAIWSATGLTLSDGLEIKAEDDLAARYSSFPDARVTENYDRTMFAGHFPTAADCVRAELSGS